MSAKSKYKNPCSKWSFEDWEKLPIGERKKVCKSCHITCDHARKHDLKRDKPQNCVICGKELSSERYYLKCKACGKVMCDGAKKDSCLRRHLSNTHKIDWETIFEFEEEE